METTLAVVVSSLVAVGAFFVGRMERRARRNRSTADTFSGQGVSIETDCRKCGQFNRVPGHRLRDRPKCGRCKATLMPGARIVLCYTSKFQGRLKSDVNLAWDHAELWHVIADHVEFDPDARAANTEAKPSVN